MYPTNHFQVSFAISPPNAVTIYPSNVTLASPASSFEVQFQPNIFSTTLIVQPVLSGPGAAYYSDPSSIKFSSVKSMRTQPPTTTYLRTLGDFLISSFTNFLVDPETEQLTVGVEAGPFGITARSVPTDVTLHLTAPGLMVCVVHVVLTFF